jgi:hypothetical protein
LTAGASVVSIVWTSPNLNSALTLLLETHGNEICVSAGLKVF